MRKFSMKNIAVMAALQLALMAGFTSCSDDDKAPSYSTAAVSNSELMTILNPSLTYPSYFSCCINQLAN